MGQKVNPHGLRVGVIKGWDSRWYAKDNAFGDLLVEDYNIRKFLKKKLYAAGVPQIEIERNSGKVKIVLTELLRLPKWWTGIAVPIGFGLSTLYSIYFICRDVFHIGAKKSTEGGNKE